MPKRVEQFLCNRCNRMYYDKSAAIKCENEHRPTEINLGDGMRFKLRLEEMTYYLLWGANEIPLTEAQAEVIAKFIRGENKTHQAHCESLSYSKSVQLAPNGEGFILVGPDESPNKKGDLDINFSLTLTEMSRLIEYVEGHRCK